MKLSFASIASAAGPITVHLSDNDPFTADWRANAADWLGKLGAAVHIAHGAGHYMTTGPGRRSRISCSLVSNSKRAVSLIDPFRNAHFLGEVR
jgi:hypothetical protein